MKVSDSWPVLLVVPLMVMLPLLKTPPAPPPAAVKVTLAPGHHVAELVGHRGHSKLANAVLTVALCPEPEVTV